jgi:flagellin
MAEFPIVNARLRSTLIGVQQARQLIEISSKRLATGLRVSSPFEGVSAFFDANALNSRAARLLSIKDKITNGAIVTAGTIAALDEVIAIVEAMKAVANSALGVSATISANTVTTALADVTDTITGAVDNDAFTISHDGTTTTITNTAGSTFTSIAAQIDAISDLTAIVSDGNEIVITAVDGKNITITESVNNLAADLGVASSTNGTFITSAKRQVAELNFDDLRDQISTIIGAATFLGTNLIASSPGSLTVQLADNSTSKVTISGVSSSAASLSISAVDTAGNFATNAGIIASIAELDTALATLRSTKATFKTNDSILDSRTQFVENLIELLGEGAKKLTVADLEEESATILALQTRHDLAIVQIDSVFESEKTLANLLRLN